MKASSSRPKSLKIPPHPPATGGMRLTRRGFGGRAPDSGRTRPEGSRTAQPAVDALVAAVRSTRSSVATGPARGVRGQTTIRARGPRQPVRSHSTLQQPGRLIPTGGVTGPAGSRPPPRRSRWLSELHRESLAHFRGSLAADDCHSSVRLFIIIVTIVSIHVGFDYSGRI